MLHGWRSPKPFVVHVKRFGPNCGHARGLFFEEMGIEQRELDSMFEVISAHRSPEYRNAVRAYEERIQASFESATPSVPDPFLTSESGLASAGVRSSRLPKEKIKTRPPNASPPVAEEGMDFGFTPSPVDHEDDDEFSGPIKVSDRAFSVLTLMFPRTAEEADKSVIWDRFVHAMSDVGFTAQHSGGSAVSFENSKNASGKIVFHKPHSVAKIDPVMLHSIGRRMAKWFGWRRGPFFLEREGTS